MHRMLNELPPFLEVQAGLVPVHAVANALANAVANAGHVFAKISTRNKCRLQGDVGQCSS